MFYIPWHLHQRHIERLFKWVQSASPTLMFTGSLINIYQAPIGYAGWLSGFPVFPELCRQKNKIKEDCYIQNPRGGQDHKEAFVPATALLAARALCLKPHTITLHFYLSKFLKTLTSLSHLLSFISYWLYSYILCYIYSYSSRNQSKYWTLFQAGLGFVHKTAWW